MMRKDAPLPPQLDMNAYADFIENGITACDGACLARQKQIEERVEKAFRHQPASRGKPSFPVMRKSCSAEPSFAMELKRLRGLSVEERVLEALGMGDRFSWLAPTRKEDS